MIELRALISKGKTAAFDFYLPVYNSSILCMFSKRITSLL